MQVKIEQAKFIETEIVLSVLREAENWLEEKGVPLWKHNELKIEYVAPDVEGGMYWLAKVGGEVAGCVRFQLEDKELWDDVPHEDSAFVHRLAVRRKFAGGAVSKALLDWAKERAKREGKRFLRLDCAKREPLCKLYESYNFEKHSEKQAGVYRVVRYEFRLV